MHINGTGTPFPVNPGCLIGHSHVCVPFTFVIWEDHTTVRTVKPHGMHRPAGVFRASITISLTPQPKIVNALINLPIHVSTQGIIYFLNISRQHARECHHGRRFNNPSASTHTAIRPGPHNPTRAKSVAGRAYGNTTVRKPVCSIPKRMISWPLASNATEMPVFAARKSGNPSSTARNRAAAKCCRGPVEVPNHASFVTFTNHAGRSFSSQRGFRLPRNAPGSMR